MMDNELNPIIGFIDSFEKNSSTSFFLWTLAYKSNREDHVELRNSTMETVTVKATERSEEELEILRALRGIRYGSVEITIHDSKVVQVERTEKVRFDRKPGTGNGK